MSSGNAARPHWSLALAGIQAGTVGALILLGYLALDSAWHRHSVWTVPNLLASTFYGESAYRQGFSAGTSVGYDFSLDKLQYGEVQANYNWNCCGLSFEVRRYSLGVVPEHTTYLYNFTLANVGSAGSLSWAERVF